MILSYGVYGKWLHFRDGYPEQWERMCEEHPDVPSGSTNKYRNWEVVDPEFSGVGPFRHNDSRDRPAEIFGGMVTLHMSPNQQAHVLLPLITPR